MPAHLRGLFTGNAANNLIDPWLARSRQERSEEHTSELQSLMRISYAVFCLKKKNERRRHEQLCGASLQHTSPGTLRSRNDGQLRLRHRQLERRFTYKPSRKNT